jgi:KTSC domain
MQLAVRAIALLVMSLPTSPLSAETVDVRYRGPIDLKPFACTDTPRSSFVQRVCYDKAQSYMLINLRGTYYHYCELPLATFDALLAAPSIGQFYNQRIKGTGSDGPFDCRTHRVPMY